MPAYETLPANSYKLVLNARIQKGELNSSIPLIIESDKLDTNTTYLLVIAIDTIIGGVNRNVKQDFVAIEFGFDKSADEQRVNSYQAYPNPDETAKKLKTSSYSQYSNPTGIYFEEGDSIIVHAENITQDNVFLKLNAWEKDWAESKFLLRNGVNKFVVEHAGNSYLEYYSKNYEIAPSIKLRFETGKVNGVFDKSKHDDRDWKNILANSVATVMDIVGDRVQLIYPVEELKKHCPEEGTFLVNLYDSIITIQHQIMGLDKYKMIPKNKILGRVIWQGFMHADRLGAAFHVSTMPTLANPYKIIEDSWGIAHEFGHVNQVRPDMKWVGTTEVTNNIYSIWTQYMFKPSHPKFELEVNSSYDDQAIICGRYNSYFESAFIHQQPWLTQAGPDEWKRWHDEANPPYWHGDHFVKLIPLWQLQLYFSVIGEGTKWHKPDFFADIFNQAITSTETLTDGEHQLNFMKRVCDATETDLTDFFEKARMLVEIDEFIGDYTSAQLTITAEQINQLKEHASQYSKPEVPAINYVSANSIEAVRNKKSVKGVLNEGTQLEEKKVRVDNGAWQNVLAFETYNNEELIKVSLVGTGSDTNTETLVSFPSNATHIKAIAWNGKRTLVYKK